jgi:IS30 family transposase
MKKRRFKHLSWNDRLRIESFLKCGKRVQEIADEIGVHRNTIYNELKRGRYIHRNSDWTEEERYSPDIAEAAYRENLAAKGPGLKIGKDHRLAAYIERRIVEDGYSPAAVLGEIKVKGIQFDTTICEATLYSYIKKGVFLTLEAAHLPRQGMKKRQYKKVKKTAARPSAGRSIEKRSPEIDDRAEIGHWEMDCVEGKKKTKETLLVLTERKARKEIMVKMKDKTTGSVVAALDRLERRYGKLFSKVFQTITVDNGTEFSDVDGLERSCLHKGERTTVFYCHPYSSYERGTNENTNGMIRRWFPKGTDFGKVSAKDVQAVEDWLNAYPREILGFRTADEVFAEEVAALV